MSHLMSNLAPCSWHVKESTGESLVYVGVLSGSNEGCYSAWNLVESGGISKRKNRFPFLEGWKPREKDDVFFTCFLVAKVQYYHPKKAWEPPTPPPFPWHHSELPSPCHPWSIQSKTMLLYLLLHLARGLDPHLDMSEPILQACWYVLRLFT